MQKISTEPEPLCQARKGSRAAASPSFMNISPTSAILLNYRGDWYRATEIEWLTRMVESNAG
jgi:hypothetical protein